MTKKELEAELQKAQESLEFTHEWYAVRIERLRDFSKEKGVWHEVAAILANGTLTGITDGKVHYEPPTYAQKMNTLRWDLEKAQKELSDFKSNCSCKKVNKSIKVD